MQLNHKINLQARIRRHSRILKDNLGNTLYNSKKRNFGYWVVALLLIIMFPIYPAFSNTELRFDRSEIDESSILSYYDEDPLLNNVDDEILFETKDSFLSIGSFVEESFEVKDISVTHKIKKGDTLRLIAKKYSVSEDTIKWATGIKDDKGLKIGEEIVFPSIDGIFYTVKRGDTISGIASKYGIKSSEISKQNNLINFKIRLGQKLILPGVKYIKEEEVKKKEKKVYKKKPYIKKTYRKNKTYKKTYISAFKNVIGRYPLKWHRPKSGAPGNCTWYVASYKNVDWRGNANQWLYRARAKGHKTGNYAKNGAIVVLGGRGYNRRYGHVAIVREVYKDYLIISDMNYRKLYQVTIRKIKRYGSHIKGYIYVN